MALLDDLEHKSDEDLIRSVASMNRDNPNRVDVELVLQARNCRRQVDAGLALVGATNKLAMATWALTAVSVLLFAAAAIQAYPTFKAMLR